MNSTIDMTFNKSLAEHTKYLYSTLSLHELILYYFIIYIIIRFIQRILKIDFQKDLPNMNSSIIFVMTLVIVFEYLISKVFLFYSETILLNQLVIAGTLLIILVYVVKWLIKKTFNLIYHIYMYYSFRKHLTSKVYEGKKLENKKIKLKSNVAFDRYKDDIIIIYIDTSILFILISYYWNLNNYNLLVIVSILTFMNCYFSYRENLIDKIINEVKKYGREIENYMKI